MNDRFIDYDVDLTLRLSTRIAFDMSGREDTVISKFDAIDNAIGSLPYGFFEQLEGEGWTIAYPVDGEAERTS